VVQYRRRGGQRRRADRHLGGGAAGLDHRPSTRRLQADIHTATQSTLADMRKGFTETLERMDQRTERMNILAEERHREALELIAALKR
jgi:hypothetical protein